MAVTRRSIPEVEAALAGGANIDERFDEGTTALMLAARGGWADGVGLLLSRGADVQQRDHLGYTALGLAYWDGERTTGATADAYSRTVDLLRRAGCPE